MLHFVVCALLSICHHNWESRSNGVQNFANFLMSFQVLVMRMRVFMSFGQARDLELVIFRFVLSFLFLGGMKSIEITFKQQCIICQVFLYYNKNKLSTKDMMSGLSLRRIKNMLDS